LREGARVTVRLGEARTPAPAPSHPHLAAAAPAGGIAGSLAPPRAPVSAAGLYWGYATRLAPDLATALDGGPWGKGGYDLRIGTSERGVDAATVFPSSASTSSPSFRHALVGFGGPAGLEAADPGAASRFTHWVNTCPGQGSRTIRTEEAVLISMAALRPAVDRDAAVGGGFKALG
jgi:methyltransferase